MARAGIGRAGQRPPSWYGAVASFVTRCRTCRTPDVVELEVDLEAQTGLLVGGGHPGGPLAVDLDRGDLQPG